MQPAGPTLLGFDVVFIATCLSAIATLAVLVAIYAATTAKDPSEAASNHSPRAAFDDAVVADGAALLAELTVRRMNRV